MSTQGRRTSRRKQRGIVAVIMTIAMLALLAVTALAIDVNHMYMNRTKLQNGVDAAALAAAVVLDNSGSESDAKVAVSDTLTKLVSTSGNSELDLGSAVISVTFNTTPITKTFKDGACSGTSDCYVRVAVSNMDLQSFFMQMFSDTKQIAASAVAGPSAGAGAICNLAPIAVCHIEGGYVNESVYTLKTVSPDTEIGAGNFHLLNLGTSKDTHLRDQAAGGYSGCAINGENVETKPGNTVGSFAQGINTRFDGPSPPASDEAYIKDLNTETKTATGEDLTYSDYLRDPHNNRRMLIVPIIDCTTPDPDPITGESTTNGNTGGVTEFKVVSLGCFFMRNRAPENASSNANGNVDDDLKGEYVSECSANNAFNNGENSTNGPYRIVLYNDPLSEES